MSKKIIGPTLPPHLRHLVESRHSDGDSSKSPRSPPLSRTPNNSVEDEEGDDDGVLVLHVSDDELSLDGPRAARQSRDRRAVSESSGDEDAFGPPLPPSLRAACSADNRGSSDDDGDSFGPVLPPDTKTDSRVRRPSKTSRSAAKEDSFGPVLPPDARTDPGRETKTRLSSEEDDSFGPVLPPNFKIPSPSELSRSSDEDDSFGPPPPPDFGPAPVKVIGPTLPPPDHRHADPEAEADQSDEDDVVGPMPPTEDAGASASYAQQLLDARALRMKRKLAGEDDDASSRVVARETWMLELPPDRSSEFGLGPRQFRARAKLDLGDRSVWTDTPDDKERRASAPQQSEATNTVDLKSETEMIAIAERDRAMQKLTDKHNKKKKRKESLIDLHQKKLKKKQKKEEEDGKPKERRPFDRNLDLQANRFDEAQKKAILRKAQLLDDRFSRGESKFL